MARGALTGGRSAREYKAKLRVVRYARQIPDKRALTVALAKLRPAIRSGFLDLIRPYLKFKISEEVYEGYKN